MKNLAALARSAQHDQVIAEGRAVRGLFPEYVEEHSAYELIAEACLAKGDKPAAEAEFNRYMKAGGRSPETLKKLASLLAERGAAREAAVVLDRLNYVYPNDEGLHRRLGDLWMKAGDAGRAVREYSAVLAMQPQDVATSHFNLARAFRQAGQMEQAEEHLFLALEAAPGYRAAQQMLLEISGGQNQK
jgi:tetratricopeptide (TPR) repeat protein